MTARRLAPVLAVGGATRLVSQMNDHVRPCNLKPQQRDLMPVLRRPVEPAVKTGKAQCEHIISALPPKADSSQTSRHVRKVPRADMQVQTFEQAIIGDVR